MLRTEYENSERAIDDDVGIRAIFAASLSLISLARWRGQPRGFGFADRGGCGKEGKKRQKTTQVTSSYGVGLVLLEQPAFLLLIGSLSQLPSLWAVRHSCTMREARRSVASEPEAALDAEDELVDLTEALVVRSKRTERQKRKQKTKLASGEPVQLHDLPTELILDILSYLRPNDVFRLTRTSKSLHAFVTDHRRFLASKIIEYRYPCLQKSLRLPALLEDVRPDLRQALRSDKRQRSLHIHKKPYQHQLEPPDPAYVCTCLTCVLRWNALCIAVDFAHWQSNLEKGEPIPVIGRGQSPAWNQKLIAEHAAVVRKALRDPPVLRCYSRDAS